MKPHVLKDFRTFIETSDPPISSQSTGPYLFVLEGKLQSYTHTPPTNDSLPVPSEPKESELIALYHQLSSAQQDTLLEVAQALASKAKHP